MLQDVSDSHPEVAAALRTALDKWSHEVDTVSTSPTDRSEETEAAMRSLGYLE